MIASLINFPPLTQSPDWQWQTWQDLPYLTCNLLKNWQHGFFTSLFYPRSPEELTLVLTPSATSYRVKQVHSNQVLTPSEILAQSPENAFPEADALISDQSLQALWVASADCTPILIGDCVTGQVSAIHAGWRGTAQRIVPQAIQRFIQSGSRMENLRVAMGPAIAGRVYQVSEEVAAQVGASLFVKEQKSRTPEAILGFLEALDESPTRPDPEEGKIRLDVRRVNALQLQQMGLSQEQIAIAPYCTYQQPDLFFSYRRTQEKQVQWSGIVSKGEVS